MTTVPEGPHDAEVTGGLDPAALDEERERLRDFVKSLTRDDIRSGSWFTKLLGSALSTYTDKATWEFFQDKYLGVPVDAIVEQRIAMAANYAALEGGLSAGAYTAAIAATLGTAGGASPVTVPAALATVLVDITYLTQLQLRLAFDISVLYGVGLDVDDPDDLWKLIRVALTIKGGEAAREGLLKVAPAAMRPLVKRFYSRGVLAAAKGLPVVGKHLLQRNVIKVAIPLVGVPLAVGINRYTTLIAGRHARAVFRNEARVREVAERLSKNTRHPKVLVWVAWLVVFADKKISSDEAVCMRYLAAALRRDHGIVDREFDALIEIDPDDVWHRLAGEAGDMQDILEGANKVATVDGPATPSELAVLAELAKRIDAGRIA